MPDQTQILKETTHSPQKKRWVFELCWTIRSCRICHGLSINNRWMSFWWCCDRKSFIVSSPKDFNEVEMMSISSFLSNTSRACGECSSLHSRKNRDQQTNDWSMWPLCVGGIHECRTDHSFSFIKSDSSKVFFLSATCITSESSPRVTHQAIAVQPHRINHSISTIICLNQHHHRFVVGENIGDH